jgi:uncharacterized protein YyaL (SSP411 family)
MPNQLINETSPYLLQHADNPVEWYPWGEEALELAREQNKPIFLSIGYAACHWCHVMAHESFEDDDTATLMNAHFVNIKVDREERPDLDNIYMQAVQAMTGSGGWPMTLFLTPDGQPFYGGTYFPPEPRYGIPGFRQLLVSVADAWKNRGDELLQNAEKVTEHIQQSTSAMAEVTLQKMASGGIYDQVGGGFARYSTDERWLVPHFEKMLYDNAQLARVYLHAWQITGNPLYRRITEETLEYVLREMTHVEGGFYSSQDADSEGVEGKFYVWSAREIQQALGENALLFMAVYDVSEGGNWEGHNILQRVAEPDDVADQFGLTLNEAQAKIEAARQKMYQVRSQRVWPDLDDKVLTAWNGLMLAAFAEAGRVLGRQDYVDAATRNAEFLYNTMRTDNGRLLRTWKDGSEPKYNAYLEDYAYLAEGLLALYQTTFEVRWFEWARELVDLMLTHFCDEDNGGFFDTSDDHEALLQRPKDLQDNAVPSGNAMAVHALLKLSLYTGNGKYWDMAEGTASNMASQVARYPSGFGEWLNVANFMLSEPVEIAMIGDLDQLVPFLEVVRDGYRPNQVVAAGPETDDEVIPLLAHRSQIDGMGTAYVCRRFVCQKPVTNAQYLMDQLT